MLDVSMKPITNNQAQVQTQKITPKPEAKELSKPEVEIKLKAEGTKEIGEKALEKAINDLPKLLEGKEVNVNTVVDDNGQQQVSITDRNTGKKIVQIPPDAAVEIADKAKQENIGWLLDTLA